MDNRQFLIELVKTIALFVAPVLSFWLGQKSAAHSKQDQVLETRLKDFYLPYMRFNVKALKFQERIENGDKIVEKYLNFLLDNYHLTETKTQHMILSFVYSVIGKDNLTEKPELVDVVIKLSDRIFDEYKKVCKRLKYPAPTPTPVEPLIRKETQAQTQSGALNGGE